MCRCLAAGCGQPTTTPLPVLAKNFGEDGQELGLTKACYWASAKSLVNNVVSEDKFGQ